MVNITYETLFDLVRIEKNRDEIQELNATFYRDVLDYLEQKRSLVKKKEHESDIRDIDEVRKLQLQMDNIYKLIRDLYERREKKILDIALNKSRTNSSLVVPKNLLAEEMCFYEQTLLLLNTARSGILQHLFQHKFPQLSFTHDAAEQKNNSAKSSTLPSENAPFLVRFLKPVPQFLGPELESYGPFVEDDIANLPPAVVNVLLEKKRVEKL